MVQAISSSGSEGGVVWVTWQGLCHGKAGEDGDKENQLSSVHRDGVRDGLCKKENNLIEDWILDTFEPPGQFFSTKR